MAKEDWDGVTVEEAQAWLDANPRASLDERIPMAVFVAVDGDHDKQIDWMRSAELAGCEPDDVFALLLKLKFAEGRPGFSLAGGLTALVLDGAHRSAA